MKTQVYMVRHCESEGNACRRCHAQFDGIVTRKGLYQSEALAERFRDNHVDAIYSSDAYRSRMTAAPLAKQKGIAPQYRMLLREYTIGNWEGMGIGDVARANPEAWDVWVKRPWDHNIPGADIFTKVADRGTEIIRRMAKENPGGVVVAVTHSCTLTCTLTRLLGQPISYYTNIKSGDNTAVTLIDVNDQDDMDVRFINDDSHLNQELRRSNYTGRGRDSNMAFDYAVFPKDTERFLEFYHKYFVENDNAYYNKTILENTHTIHKQIIIFPMLMDRTCGMIILKELAELPATHGFVDLFYVLEELRPNGYCEQSLGEAIDALRRMGKQYLAIRRPTDEYGIKMCDRFCFKPMAYNPNILELAITVPGIDGPIY